MPRTTQPLRTSCATRRRKDKLMSRTRRPCASLLPNLWPAAYPNRAKLKRLRPAGRCQRRKRLDVAEVVEDGTETRSIDRGTPDNHLRHICLQLSLSATLISIRLSLDRSHYRKGRTKQYLFRPLQSAATLHASRSYTSVNSLQP